MPPVTQLPFIEILGGYGHATIEILFVFPIRDEQSNQSTRDISKYSLLIPALLTGEIFGAMYRDLLVVDDEPQ